MCDFKPGDEVVCVDAIPPLEPGRQPWMCVLKEGSIYQVSGVGLNPAGEFRIFLSDTKNIWLHTGEDYGFLGRRFRKVQRKNSRLTLEAFFTVPGGFEEPKRAPAKKKTNA